MKILPGSKIHAHLRVPDTLIPPEISLWPAMLLHSAMCTNPCLQVMTTHNYFIQIRGKAWECRCAQSPSISGWDSSLPEVPENIFPMNFWKPQPKLYSRSSNGCDVNEFSPRLSTFSMAGSSLMTRSSSLIIIERNSQHKMDWNSQHTMGRN